VARLLGRQVAEETARYMDDPDVRIKHPVNDDDEGRKALMRNGWNIRGGKIFRQTSLGEIAYCAEEVMFGRIPDYDPVAAKDFTQQRAAWQPEYRDAFVRYLHARGDQRALSPSEQNALSEGISEGGGYLVPPDVGAEILARRARASVMRQLCSVRMTSRDRYQLPAVAPHSSSGSIYSSGFVGGLVGETPSSNTDSGPTFVSSFAVPNAVLPAS